MNHCDFLKEYVAVLTVVAASYGVLILLGRIAARSLFLSVF